MCDLANSVYDPYRQSNDDLVDLKDYHKGAPLPPERFVPPNHEASGHLLECPQLLTVQSKTSKKARSPNKQASYLNVKEEKENAKAHKRKENARRQRKEARRIRDAEAKEEARIAVKLAAHRPAQCQCYDALSDSEEDVVREEAKTVRHTHTDGTTSFHLPNCLTEQSATIRKIYTYTPKPPPSIGREKKGTEKAQMKTKSTSRKPPKSAAYIFSDGEEEGEEAGPASPAAKRYNSRTIASDILRAIGQHPYLPPLNAHIEGYPTKGKGRATH